jgi:hypothetical protein
MIYLDLATVRSVHVLFDAQFEFDCDVTGAHMNRQVPDIVGNGAFDVSFDIRGHVSHWDVDTFIFVIIFHRYYYFVLSVSINKTKFTNGFEIIVQVVLADHLVFADKVFTASHFNKNFDLKTRIMKRESSGLSYQV